MHRLAHTAPRRFTRLRLSLVSHSVTWCSACDVVAAVVFVVAIHTVANSVWLAPSPNVHIIILLCAPYMHSSITFVPFFFSFLGSFLLFFISVSTRYLLYACWSITSLAYTLSQFTHSHAAAGAGKGGNGNIIVYYVAK